MTLEGDEVSAGDPGVNAEDTNADRSIWPIPESVPVPEAGHRRRRGGLRP